MSSKCAPADFHQPPALYKDINIFTGSILSLQRNIERNITLSRAICQYISNNSIYFMQYYVRKRLVTSLLNMLFGVCLSTMTQVPKYHHISNFVAGHLSQPSLTGNKVEHGCYILLIDACCHPKHT